MNKSIPNIKEIILVFMGLSLLTIFFSTLPLKEAHTDVIWYLNMGLNNIQDPHWLTRYTHVFLQKGFISLFTNPFTALKAYWIFLMVSSSGLIYYLTRSLNKKSNFINGSLAIILFLSYHLNGINYGVAWADLTSMLVVLVALTLFLVSSKRGHEKTFLLFLLGALFVVAFKTKETAWVIFYLFLPLAFDKNNSFDYRLFFHRTKHLMIGVLFGVFVYIFLNFLFLKDAFFDFRIENISDYLSFWLIDANYHKKSVDWFRSDVFLFFPLIFMLYLYKGTLLKKTENKIIWLYPVLLLSFLTVGMVKNTYTIYPRFLYPAFAVTCIFAAQAIEFKFPKTRKKQLFFFTLLSISLIVYQLIQIVLMKYINSRELDFSQFVSSVFQPLIFSGLFIYFVFFNKLNYKTAIIPIILVLAFVRPNISKNYRQALWQPTNGIIQKRFYPLDKFGDEIVLSKDMLVYISPNLPDQLGYMDSEIDTIRTIFDLHFLTTTDRSNFSIEPNLDNIFSSLLDQTYNYLFFTLSDWEEIASPIEKQQEILTICSVSQDENQPIVFLNCN